MQEAKNYIIRNIKVLLDLEEAPYELTDGTSLDKFLQSDQDTLLLSCLPTKEFRTLTPTSAFPTEGHIVQVTKLRSDGPLAAFFSISVKPASQFGYLSAYIKNVYEHILVRTKDPSLFKIKELKAVLANTLKTKLINETDINFNSFEDEFDFWQ